MDYRNREENNGDNGGAVGVAHRFRKENLQGEKKLRDGMMGRSADGVKEVERSRLSTRSTYTSI